MAQFDFTKDPAAVLDWHVDWSSWLSGGETVTASAFEVSAALVKVSESSTSTTATVWLAGGAAGRVYDVVNTVSTSQGRTDRRRFTVKVTDRRL